MCIRDRVVDEGMGAVGNIVNVVFLRMRPDVMIIGETVSEEAIEFIMGLNLGITAFTTTHAHSARLAMTRIETLSRGSGIPLDERREIIGSGLGLAVHIHKGYDPDTQNYRRRMREMIAINGVKRTAEGVELRVHPTLIPAKRLIANVEGAMNAVLVKADAVGPTLYYGKGAGAEPTASAVIADLVDVTRMHTADPEHRVPHLAFQPDAMVDLAILPIAGVRCDHEAAAGSR